MQKKSLSRYWLIIGVAALAVAGLYSLVLAGGRSPKLGESSLLHRLFHEALVVHVDLSVLVWFLAMACLMWSLMSRGTKTIIPYVEEAALISFALGAFAITVSPFGSGGEALMSNYIPVIHSPVFFMGLMLVLCGTLFMLLKALTVTVRSSHFSKTQQFALFSASIITLIALLCFCWSYYQIPPIIEGQQYYEMLFWGGGHVLQFTHVQVMMVSWMLLIATLKPDFKIHRPWLFGLYSIGLVAALISPFPYLFYDITTSPHREFFTQQMIYMGGVAPVFLALMLLPPLSQTRRRNALWSALLMSIVLFLYGGALGGMIQGQNVVIPAHYHGSIVGVTLAFMGAAYLLLPKFGYRDVIHDKLAFWQPIIYGAGQIMHVSGFAWSGGYGALRKTPGMPLDEKARIAMGLMGGGAGLAAIGGLIFVIVVFRAMRKSQKAA